MIEEHDRVVLTADLPGEKLAAGHVGTVVQVHGDGKAYEVEFVALDGETVTVVTLPLRSRSVPLKPPGFHACSWRLPSSSMIAVRRPPASYS